MNKISLFGILGLISSAYLHASSEAVESALSAREEPNELPSVQTVHYLPAQQVATDRRQYERKVLQRSLELTRKQYGDFSLEVWQGEDMTFSRGTREIKRGETVNVGSNPYSPELEQEGIDLIKIPLMKGLLGYRALVVRNADLEKLQGMTTEEFLALPIGQLEYWSDNAIYEANELKVINGKSLDMLFSMLARERFDYIPLGVGEVESMLDEEARKTYDISVLPNTFIYYPFPVYLYVCSCEQQLSERVRIGLTRLINSGELESLFIEHFKDAWMKTHAKGAQIIKLTNPFLPGLE